MTASHFQHTVPQASTLPSAAGFFDRIEEKLTREAAKGFVALRLMLAGSAIAAVFVLLGYVIFGPENQHQFFRDIGPVTAFAAFITVSVGFAGLIIARQEQEGVRRLLNFWFLAGLGFIVLTIDAPMDLHGRAGKLIEQQTTLAVDIGFHATSDAVLAVYLLIGLVVSAIYWRELLRYPLVLAHLVVGGVFIVGTIGIDGFMEHNSWMWVLEEEVELIGLAFIAGAFAIRLNKTRARSRAELTA